jgi:hypothetical protein
LLSISPDHISFNDDYISRQIQDRIEICRAVNNHSKTSFSGVQGEKSQFQNW